MCVCVCVYWYVCVYVLFIWLISRLLWVGFWRNSVESLEIWLQKKKKKKKKKHENQFSDDAIKTYFSVTFLYIDSVSINVKIGMLFIMFVAAGTKMRFTRILEASV